MFQGNRAAASVVAFGFALTLAACGGGGSSMHTPPSLTISPQHAGVVVATQTQQFTGTLAGMSSTLNWSVDGVAGGNATTGTVSPSGLYTPPAIGGTHMVTVATPDGSLQASATVGVTDLAGVFTYHNDLARDGVNAQEYALTGSTVSTGSFGKLFSCAVDGAVYAQPLWVPSMSIGGGTHNVIFVATQHDSLYAFDADANPCVMYWYVNLLDTLHGGTAGEASVTWNDVGNCFGDVYPEVGVTGTPVIDPTTNTIYVVSASESNVMSSGNCSGSSAAFFHRLHALDLFTGNEQPNAPVTIAATVPGTGDGSAGGMISFDSQLHHQRAGLVLSNGVVYVPFSAHEDATPYHGWLIGYSAADVQTQTAVFNTTPNGLNGADGGIWGGGGAPAVDSGGDIYVSTGNGVFDEAPPPPNADYGDSTLRLHPSISATPNGANLTVAGWFTPFNQLSFAQGDVDLGSGAGIVLPDQNSGPVLHLLVQTGKDGFIYLMDRDNMGQYNPTDNNQIVQSFQGTQFGTWGTPAFWQNNLYTGGQGDSVRQYAFDSSMGMFATTPVSQSAAMFNYPGTSPAVSSQGASNGIVWATDVSHYGYASSSGSGPAVLHAYSAANLATEYWNSSQGTGDQPGGAVKFVVPTVANGKVYLGTRTEVDVYGLK